MRTSHSQDKILVEKACALLNSGGGLLKIAISDHQEISIINDFRQQLDTVLANVRGKTDQFGEAINL